MPQPDPERETPAAGNCRGDLHLKHGQLRGGSRAGAILAARPQKVNPRAIGRRPIEGGGDARR
jgi:hypothetical protein